MSLHKEPSFSVFNDPFSEVRQESEERLEREFSFADHNKKKGGRTIIMGLIEDEEEESKGDLAGAEEYGEMWMEYAKLTWNLHRDKDRASTYFKLATQLAPNHSNILAAYARFLWEIEDNEEEEEEDHPLVEQPEAVDVLNSVTQVSENPDDLEEHYYKKIIAQDPNNALILQNYANFLYEIKGDLKGAESYYSRAVVADPKDGELTTRYAKLVWELHRDRHKASVFFERALQASFHNSNVLAAYARFLWETEDDEDETVQNSSSGEQKPANL